MRIRPTLVALLLCIPQVACPRAGVPVDAGVERAVGVDGGDLDAGEDLAVGACSDFVNLECDAGIEEDGAADAGPCVPMRLDVVLSSNTVELFARPIDADMCDCSANFVTEPGVCAQVWSDERQCWCRVGDQVVYPRRLIDDATLTWADAGVMTLEPEARERDPSVFRGSLWAYLDYASLPGGGELVVRGCFGEDRLPIPSFSPPEVISLTEETVDGGTSSWVAVLSDDSTLGHRCRGSEDPSCCGTAPDALVIEQQDSQDYNRVRAVRADAESTTSFGAVRTWTMSDPTYHP